ncbi:MAG: hypothetical protein Q4P15_10240, partial [Propionibacteriaceae bacterium]|nr:hypothetical protein [Propionibacteriaceae bacterium]
MIRWWNNTFGRVANTVVNGLTQQSTHVDGDAAAVEPALVDLCRQAATEGIVLLGNDGALPLTAGARVALFGRVQQDWFTVGYGSGGDVKPPYVIPLIEALCGAQHISMDEELAETYRIWCADNVAEQGYWGKWPRHYEEMPLTTSLVDGAA